MKRKNMQKGTHESNNNNGVSISPATNSVTSTSKSNSAEMHSLVLWKSPSQTLYFFSLELIEQIKNFAHQLLLYKKYLVFSALVCLFYTYLNQLHAAHQPMIQEVNRVALWSFYWLGLGVLSSIGLGTGLHTFLLYLGPHIAEVTLAAFECQSLNFPEPPYPNDIICPSTKEGGVSVWQIMSKVRWECIMWGTGTAIGELPPYFMARAARLHGNVAEEEGEMEELMRKGSKSLGDKLKIFMHEIVNKVGFAGILCCASIPNPLFDLAGITCGHFLVPFWTFFGATLIGKAFIKMHIQTIFVVFLFSQTYVEQALNLIQKLPWAGDKLKGLLEDFLQKQKLKMHDKAIQEENWLSWIFGQVVMVMVIYFLVSIVNSMAQAYRKRHQEKDSSS